MLPHVLAIEPDLRQAAIVKRIVREKVLADVTVVDSRDAALEAMRTAVPDVLLLSALLSPRDEDELIAHLRTLEHAEHLQTHTIPQLASSIGHDTDKPSRGLLSAFRRRKGGGAAPAGCDPELFADEVRTYLKRASDKKREVSDAAVAGVITPVPAARAATPSAPTSNPSDAEPAVTSSWASPFEWRPTRDMKAAFVADPEAVAAASPAPAPAPSHDPVSVLHPEPVSVFDPEPVSVPDPVSVPNPEPLLVARPATVVVRAKLPLVKRHAREWWFEEDTKGTKETKETKQTKDTDSELRSVLASLSVPLHVAAFAYADGCRIRRVRVTPV